MSKTQFQVPAISPTTTLAGLQQVVLTAFQRLVAQLNAFNWAQDSATQTVDIGNNRLSNVANPASPLDAVNLASLNGAIAGISRGAVGQSVNTTNVVVSATIQIAVH